MANPNPLHPFSIKREAAEPSRIRCEGCGGADFDPGDDGFFYCRDCGGQTHDMLETACADEDLLAEEGALYSAKYVRHFQSQSQSQSLSRFLSQSQTKATKEEILQSLARNLDAKEEKEAAKPTEFEDEAYQPMDFGSGRCVDEKAVADGIRMRYVQGMQLMVQMQCKELVEGFGVSPMICGVVGVVWLRYLAALKVFDDGWADKAIWEAEGAARERCERREKHTEWRIDRQESHAFSRRKPIYVWASSLRKMIPIHSSLSITFLACHIAREPILPTDLVKWALEGKLPYISAFVGIDKSLGNSSTTCPLSSKFLFRPVRSVGTWQLEVTAGSIAQCIGLHLPPVNFYAIAQRYLKQLSLPLENILHHACRIYEWSMPAELWLSANAYRLPTRVCVLSILIVAIRILYGIHGHGIWEMSLSHLHNSSQSNEEIHTSLDPGISNSHQNCCNRENHEKECDTTCSHEAKVDTTCNKDLTHTQASQFDTMDLLCSLDAKYSDMTNILDYSKGLTSYLEYCKEIVFSGITTTYEEEKLIERLWDIYEKQQEDEIMTKQTGVCDGKRTRVSNEDDAQMEGIKRCGDESRKIPRVDTLMSESSDTHDLGDIWLGDGYVDMVSESCGVPNFTYSDDIPADEEHIAGESSRNSDVEGTGIPRTNKAKDVTLTKMKLNMEENGFEYLPPRTRRRSEDYLHYRRKKKGGKLHYEAHADYYTLLRTCAKLAQVDVRIMHLGVLKLERRLSWIEQRISSSLILLLHERQRTLKESEIVCL